MKYAVIPICVKRDEFSRIIHHNVLIKYKKKKTSKQQTVYKGTKIVTTTFLGTTLVATDDYFKDETSSHTYQFYDEGYALVDCTYKDLKSSYESNGLLGKLKQYHVSEFSGISKKITFRAKDHQVAIEKFKQISKMENLNED